MAISGSLKDVKFIEILKIVGKRTGRLWIYNFDTNVYQEWFVNDNQIIAVRVNRISKFSTHEIHKAAVQLNGDSSSSYIFYARELERLPSEISQPISDVAVRLLNENLDYESYRDQFPNPETKFTASNDNSSELSGQLLEFFIKCRVELPQEFSANDAATLFQANLEQTQFNFYKLRAAGVIKPIRLASFNDLTSAKISSNDSNTNHQNDSQIIVQIEDTSQQNDISHERRGLVKRMLNALSFNRKTN